MDRKAKFRKVRGAIRKAYKVYLVWLSSDSDYDVPISKSAALEFVNLLELAEDRITAFVGSVDQVYLDRACSDSDDDWEAVQPLNEGE
jgi:hypothetical protein